MVEIALSLAALALVAGAVAGVAAGFRPDRVPGFGVAFGIYLGLLAMAASTWAQSMDILPLTLVYGAVTGALPFAATFWGLRRLVVRYRLGTDSSPGKFR
ncbi:MAG: hypothetical protein K2X51_03770 [Burkholderiales bacterium]|nr:hypothetical protein [Burkholderiales bacterium]